MQENQIVTANIRSLKIKDLITNKGLFLQFSKCDQIYNIPTAFSKRASSFGYGKKLLFTHDDNPGPGSYNPVLKNDQGCKIALGRETIISCHYVPKQYTHVGPGGSNNNLSLLSKQGFSIRKRLEQTQNDQKDFPGPGKYNQFSMIAKKLVLSSSENPKNVLFNPITSKRFNEPKQLIDTPGVGVYNVSIEKKKAVYLISTCKSQQPKSFPSEKRDKVLSPKSITPGPGNYNIQSDFK